MQTSLPAAAAGTLNAAVAAAAADATVGAKQPGRGVVPVAPPIGWVQGVLGVEGPIAGCPVLAFVVPVWSDVWNSNMCAARSSACTHYQQGCSNQDGMVKPITEVTAAMCVLLERLKALITNKV